jgi:hypothetical protein
MPKDMLTRMTDQAGTASYGFGILGRLTAETRVPKGLYVAPRTELQCQNKYRHTATGSFTGT